MALKIRAQAENGPERGDSTMRMVRMVDEREKKVGRGKGEKGTTGFLIYKTIATGNENYTRTKQTGVLIRNDSSTLPCFPTLTLFLYRGRDILSLCIHLPLWTSLQCGCKPGMQINLGVLRFHRESSSYNFFCLFEKTGGKNRRKLGEKEEEEEDENVRENCISIERVKSISIKFFFLNRSIFLLSREEKDGEDDFGPIRIAHSRGKDRN